MASDANPVPEFDRAVQRLFASHPVLGTPAGATADDYSFVISRLQRYAQRFGIPEVDAHDLAADVLGDALSGEAAIRHAPAYLFWRTRNRAFDLKRLSSRHGQSTEDLEEVRYYSEDDNDLARLLDRVASAARVEDALAAAGEADDLLVLRVVGAWLGLAESWGVAPSSRDVATAAAVSHTTVNHALKRFRAYFIEAPDDLPAA